MAYEDFTTFTETDADSAITVATNTITVTDQAGDSTSHVKLDYGITGGLYKFSGTRQQFKVSFSGASGSGAQLAVWGLSQDNGGFTDWTELYRNNLLH